MDGLLFTGATARKDLVEYVDAEGFEVAQVAELASLKAYVLEERPRMIIITDASIEALATIREVDRMVPVLVIAPATAADASLITLLTAGADACVAESLTGPLLVAWVEALFKRLERCPFGQERYVFGDVEVDVFRRTVKKRGWRILMSATEFDLLVHLIRNNGRIVSREEILREVWKYETCPTTRTVDNFICKLRRKIEGTEGGPDHLKTIKGTGYRFDLEVE